MNRNIKRYIIDIILFAGIRLANRIHGNNGIADSFLFITDALAEIVQTLVVIFG